MTRIDALKKLLEKVTAGDVKHNGFSLFRAFGGEWTLCYDAYNGSLDAAKALHEAVLPGWTACVGQNAHRNDWNAWVRFAQDGTIEQEFRASLDSPARAWLVAILKALIEMEKTK